MFVILALIVSGPEICFYDEAVIETKITYHRRIFKEKVYIDSHREDVISFWKHINLPIGMSFSIVYNETDIGMFKNIVSCYDGAAFETEGYVFKTFVVKRVKQVTTQSYRDYYSTYMSSIRPIIRVE